VGWDILLFGFGMGCAGSWVGLGGVWFDDNCNCDCCGGEFCGYWFWVGYDCWGCGGY